MASLFSEETLREKLLGKKLFIATPMYGGMCHGAYLTSFLALQKRLVAFGVDLQHAFTLSESLITRARNKLVDSFLYRTDCTHLLFLDADIGFEADDVVDLLAMDLPVSGAAYSRKMIHWDNLKKAVLNNPNITGAELERVVGTPVIGLFQHASRFIAQVKAKTVEPYEVEELGTGYMLIRRDVFNQLAAAYPDRRYLPATPRNGGNGPEHVQVYFDTMIDPNSRRYLSEDYMFCQSWRQIGGKIYLCPWMRTTHSGGYKFHSDLVATAEWVGSL